MMNFEMFKQWTKQVLQKRFPDAAVEVSPIRGEYTGLSLLRNGQSAGYVINLDAYYQRYCNKEDYDKLVEEMIEESEDDGFGEFLDKYLQYDDAKKRLIAQLRYMDAVPEDALCYEMGDFGMLFFLLVDKYAGGQKCMRISKELLDVFGVSKEQLMRDALKNSEVLMPPLVAPVDTYVRDGMGYEEGGSSTMMIVTNRETIRGAVVLFYEGMLDRIASYLQDDLLIVPSSIHEMLVLPASEHVGNEENLEELIQELNRTRLVSSEEKLSDHLYYFHRFTHAFGIVYEEEEDGIRS